MWLENGESASGEQGSLLFLGDSVKRYLILISRDDHHPAFHSLSNEEHLVVSAQELDSSNHESIIPDSAGYGDVPQLLYLIAPAPDGVAGYAPTTRSCRAGTILFGLPLR
jgi:hypothetical protein